MIIACCCDRPTILEEKRVILAVPFPGYAGFVDAIGQNEGGYLAKKYLAHETRDTDPSGRTQRTLIHYDKDSGSFLKEVFTDSGFSGVGGNVTGDVLVSETHVYRTFQFPFPPFATSRRDEFLSDPIFLTDIHAAGLARWHAIVANDAMRAPFVVNGVDNTGADRQRTVLFPSEITDPTTQACEVRLYPSLTYPWDGKFVMTSGNTGAFFLDATNFSISNVGFPPYGSSGGLSYDADEDNFFTPFSESIWFEKQCLALPDGMGCHTAGGEVKGVLIYSCDPAAVTNGRNYLTDISNPELRLAPGYYTFDGVSITVHSGAILNDPPPVFPEFGWTYRTRTDVPGTLGYTPEWCPP